MKSRVFLVLYIMGFLLFTGKTAYANSNMEDECCMELSRNSPCEHQDDNQCPPEGCRILITCRSMVYLGSESLKMESNASSGFRKLNTPYLMSYSSDYSSSNWHPPAV